MAHFALGLESTVNHADPTLAEYPLNVPDMHWSWNPAAGYKFLLIEGKVDGNNDGDFDDAEDVDVTYHCATDPMYREDQLMVMLDIPSSRIEAELNSIRACEYAPLRLLYNVDLNYGTRQSLNSTEQVRSVVIAEGSQGEGHTLQELPLEELNVEVVDVQRHAIRVPGRLLDTRLRAGDVVMLRGKPGALARAAAFITARH